MGADRALLALLAFGGIAAIASGASASSSPSPAPSSPSSPPPKPRAAGSSPPAPSSVLVLVADAQRTLNALGAKLETDGLYGPKTAAAWSSAAKARGLVGSFLRVDGKHARVNQETARKLNALAIARGVASRSSSPSSPTGNVTLGPITTIKTQPDGVVQRWTDARGMTAAERAEWARETGDLSVYGNSPLDLLSDDQAYALEAASIEQTRAEMAPGDRTQQERAKLAAQKARELLSGKRVAPVPSNPTVSAPVQERGDDDDDDVPPLPKAYVSPPTPINLELARREAPQLAKHLKSKGRAGYSRQSLRAFQGHAGITVDGIYGPLAEDALRYFGVPNPPAAFFKAKAGSVITYAPT